LVRVYGARSVTRPCWQQASLLTIAPRAGLGRRPYGKTHLDAVQSIAK
jgi:hypothetical protein